MKTWLRLFCILTFASCITALGCGPRRIALPTDAGTPFPDFAAVHKQVAAACTGVRTLTAQLSLSGRVGGQRLSGRVTIPRYGRAESLNAGIAAAIVCDNLRRTSPATRSP